MAGGRAGTLLLPPLFETQVQDEDVKREEEDNVDGGEDSNANGDGSYV